MTNPEKTMRRAMAFGHFVAVVVLCMVAAVVFVAIIAAGVRIGVGMALEEHNPTLRTLPVGD